MGLAPRQWVYLIIFYTSYLMLGACVFYHIEHNAETERRAKELAARIEIHELLVSFTSPDDVQIQKDILNRVSTYCNKPVTDYRDDEFVNPYQWTFYHAVFFAFIVCSTLGYGNMTPSGTVGRYFMIAYALVGMPVNMILYTYLGEYFRRNFVKVYRKYKAFKFARHMHENANYKQHRWSMIGEITICLILPALVILVFIPSLIFTYFEGWDYSISVYYSFVTLLTIGFGDFVPTFQPHQERTFGIYFIFYEIFVFFWFVFGLCYILMLIGFIARGMQSKKIRQFEKQLAENIKLTHNRIWSGVSKDVGYLRRILNEIYIMRVRPVFTESIDVKSGHRMARSQSCPELKLFSCKTPITRRKRAQSEICFNQDVYTKSEKPNRSIQLQSRHSETNLMRIDKVKTFEKQNVLGNTGELLAQVVFALSSLHQTDDETAATALRENEWSVVTASNDLKSKKLRSRAKSLHPQISKISTQNIDTSRPQFTWSGNNNDIQAYINAQAKQPNTVKSAKKDGNGVSINGDKPKDTNANGMRRKSILTTLNNVFRRRNTTCDASVEAPNDSNEQFKPMTKFNRTPPFERKCSMKVDADVRKSDPIRRPSLLSNHSSCSEQLLENTTIADLIRAIENAHVQNIFGAKPFDSLNSRRISLAAAAQTARRGSNTAGSPSIETQSPNGSTRSNPHRLSVVTEHNRISPKRPKHFGRGRFSVTPVVDSSASSSVSLSPILQRRIRRFSAIPSDTIMPQRKLSTSLQTTPLALRRTQFKQTISPLAMQPPTTNSTAVFKSTTSFNETKDSTDL